MPQPLGYGMQRIPLPDFRGGWVPRQAASQFADGEWRRLDGVVIEEPGSVRSQWAMQPVGDPGELVDLYPIADMLVGRTGDGEFYWTTLPTPHAGSGDADDRDWSPLEDNDGDQIVDDTLHIVGEVPVRREGTGFRKALLLNGVDREGPAWAVTKSADEDEPSVYEYDLKYPDPDGDDDEEDRVMPPANVGAMWGDALALGDVMWLDDDGDLDDDDGDPPVLDEDNVRRHPAGVWISQAGRIDRWDPLDFLWASFSESRQGEQVESIVSTDLGLLIFTRAGIVFLRGDAGQFEFHPLKLSLDSGRQATFWAELGAGAFIDEAGQVWMTDGESVDRISEDGWTARRRRSEDDSIVALGEYLLCSVDGELHCFRMLGERGGWTRLATPDGTGARRMRQYGDQVYFLDEDGRPWRINRREDLYDGNERGLVDGDPVMVRVATRTMARDGGHEAAWWHRLGVRWWQRRDDDVSSHLVGVWLHDGVAPQAAVGEPVSGEPIYEESDDPRFAGEREDVVVPGLGPAPEASATVVFKGDVEVEQVEWHVHRSRRAR